MSAKRTPSGDARREAVAAGLPRYVGTPCAKCGHVERYTGSNRCVTCHSAGEAARRVRMGAPAVKDALLRSKYGITLRQHDDMLVRQGGACAICAEPLIIGERTYAVDHCHASGVVRDVLCRPCNVGLGHFSDDPQRLRAAAAYIEQHRSPDRQRSDP